MNHLILHWIKSCWMNLAELIGCDERRARVPASPDGFGSHSVAATIVAALAILTAGSCSPSRTDKRDQPIMVLAAASSAEALRAVVQSFSTETGIHVEVTTAGSNTLARQILAGAPADLFLAANPQWASFLEGHDRVVESVSLLTNRLALVVPTGNRSGITCLADVRSGRAEIVALASANVPLGRYARQVLGTQEALEEMAARTRIVTARDARMTLALVESGEVDAAIIYASDVRLMRHSKVVEIIDGALHEEIIYPLMLLRAANQPAGVERLFAAIQSGSALRCFTDYGFGRVVVGAGDSP